MQNGVMSAFPLKKKKKVLLWADKDACIAEPTLKEKKKEEKKKTGFPMICSGNFCTALLFFSQMTFVFH